MIGKWILISLLTFVFSFSLGTQPSANSTNVNGMVIKENHTPITDARLILMTEHQPSQKLGKQYKARNIEGIQYNSTTRHNSRDKGKGSVVVTLVFDDEYPVLNARIALKIAGKWGRRILEITKENESVTFHDVPIGNYGVYAIAHGADFTPEKIMVVQNEATEVELQHQGMAERYFDQR